LSKFKSLLNFNPTADTLGGFLCSTKGDYMNTLFIKITTLAALTGFCFATEEIIDDIEIGRSDSTVTQLSMSSASAEGLSIMSEQDVPPFRAAYQEPSTAPARNNRDIFLRITQFTLKHSGKIIGTVISGVIAYEICSFLATL
jgi:hypothetical protein